jgi:hypothetical protein
MLTWTWTGFQKTTRCECDDDTDERKGKESERLYGIGSHHTMEATDNTIDTSADTSTSMGDVLTRHTVVATDTEVVLQMNQRATELTRKPCIASVVGHTHVYVRWFGAFGCSYTTIMKVYMITINQPPASSLARSS